MTFPPAPRWITLTLVATCAGVGLSAIAMIAVAAFVCLKPAWLVIGFEVVALVAAVLGLLQARARLVDAPGLRARLAPRGVLVRDCASFGMPGWVRIAVPDAAGLERLRSALAASAR